MLRRTNKSCQPLLAQTFSISFFSKPLSWLSKVYAKAVKSLLALSVLLNLAAPVVAAETQTSAADTKVSPSTETPISSTETPISSTEAQISSALAHPLSAEVAVPFTEPAASRIIQGDASKLTTKFKNSYTVLPLSTESDRDESGVLNALTWKASTSNGAHLICLHALGLCPEAFDQFGERMAELGMDTTAVEVRGFGATRHRPGYHEMDPVATVSDLTKLLQGIREKEPDKKIFLIGESMGGALAIRLASEHPELVDGIVCSAPAWQLHRIRRILAKGICDLFLGFGKYRINPVKYSAEAVITQATSSPEVRTHWREDGMTKLGLRIPEAWRYYQFMKTTPLSAEKIDAVPILMVQGLRDRLSKAHGAAQLYSMFHTPQKQFAIVSNREHLVFEEGMLTDEVADFIQHWVTRQMAEQSVPKTATKVARSDDQEIEPLVVLGGTKLTAHDKKKLQELVKLSGATPKHLAITKPVVRE